ncbi:uncharacterized protein LOC126734169 [Anthonomus grandis grandis]|uniref:uncharacterized protein LOC126734169 n=1 Tax=Anthonomus grandis grandis TaxID=2921223 RepID=UPI00216659C7|nr:uncharacterized protein LOC126734169 [Anthonomus grandis grandis]
MLPRCEMFKEIIFTPRIICFNESFVTLGKQSVKNKPVAIIWHEGMAGRSKSDIISTLYKFRLFDRDAKEITLWLDNCAAQNKNWALYCFFIYLINSAEVNLNLLKIKYLQTGHTFMSADSFHHQVEKSLKQTGKVLDFDDFKKSNSSRVEVFEMNLNDFYDFADFSSRFKMNKIIPKPYLANFVEVQFKMESKNLFYKTKFSGELIELIFLLAKQFKSDLPKPTIRLAPKGIKKERKAKLLQKLQEMAQFGRIKRSRKL